MSKCTRLTQLPSLADIAIPHNFKTSYVNEQHGGNSTNIVENQIIKKWTHANNVELKPDTLIPAGMLIAVYNQYLSSNDLGDHSVYDQLCDVIGKRRLDNYMKKFKIRSISPTTKLPFAVVMGPDVFDQCL